MAGGQAIVQRLGDDSRLASLQVASRTYRIALGPRAGWKVLSLRAAVRLAGHQRKERERLSRTITRPALANERLIRFHGVLAPNAKLRGAVIPQAARKDSAPAHEHPHGQAARMRWALLLKRVFNIDVERCACGRQLKILAAIEEPEVIVEILTHLGLPARAPPHAAAREFSLVYAT